MPKGIYDLDLHESTELPCRTTVTRVPGGWLYAYHNGHGLKRTAIFVPYNEEFKTKENKEDGVLLRDDSW